MPHSHIPFHRKCIHVNAPEEKLNIVDNSRLYFVIRDYFRGSVMQNESIVTEVMTEGKLKGWKKYLEGEAIV